ncbi:hypothetical protein L3X38_033092 [Prunus dulcis]|uniref:Uncharacterized protein n=1 Tax=Prunus dulcis TaxID=3755 RepID=A0AAD4VGP4_PRUDU|nr:hypothetical protein L3X38_033092 [Prunus dulcis]
MARKEYRSLEYRKSDNDIVSILECFDKEKKKDGLQGFEQKGFGGTNMHGSVEESDFVRLEIKAKDETSAPTERTQIVEIFSNSGGKTSEKPIKFIDDFDPIKAFQLLPTQLMECSQEEP